MSGNPAQDGRDPANPSTLEALLDSHQVDNMLIICGVGAHSTATAFNITKTNVTIASRMRGYNPFTTSLSNDINIGAGVRKFQVFGFELNGNVNDNLSGGEHRFVECRAGGGTTYTRTNPARFIEFLGSSLPTMNYVVTGAGSGGTAGGGDTFMSEVADLGNVSIDTPLHYFKTRHGQTTKELSAGVGVFAIFVLEGVVINSGTANAINVPGGLVIGQNCRFNDSGGLGKVTALQSWFDDCIFDVPSSSLGAPAAGLGASYFRQIVYGPATPGDWPIVPATVAAALDELAQRINSNAAPISFGDMGINQSTTTRYLTPYFDQGSAPTKELGIRIQHAALLLAFSIEVGAGNGNGEDVVYTLRVNEVDTALAITLASTASGLTTTTTGAPITVADGDKLSVSVAKALAIGTSPTDVQAFIKVEAIP